MVDGTGFFQSTANDEKAGDGERCLVFKYIRHLPGIHQAQCDDEAEDGKRKHIRCSPLADEGDEGEGDHRQGESDFEGHKMQREKAAHALNGASLLGKDRMR